MSAEDGCSDNDSYDLDNNMNNDASSILLQQLEAAKNDYFTKQKKNIFFKTRQKSECADAVCSNFDLKTLLHHTMYNIPNTNKVYLNYPIFKQYANENNQEIIVNYFVELLSQSIKEHKMIEFHLNVNTLTVSATERYKKIIELFAQGCLKNATSFTNSISFLYIYYTPHMFETIFKFVRPFMDPLLVKKIIKYSKNESDVKINDLIQA
jgi:hypothetical protein